MKKLVAMLLALVMVVSMAACASKKEEQSTEDPNAVVTPVEPETPSEEETPDAPVEEETPDAAEEETPDAPVEEAPAMSPEAAELMETLKTLLAGMPEDLATQEIEVAPDMFEYYTFVPQVEGAVAVLSEAMINAVAHSVVLVKLPEGADVEAFASTMDANKNPAKWVCVEAEESFVKTSGQYVLLVMSAKDTADIIAANWDAAFGA